ncbi:teleost multiple tissue opsin b [Lates japonicus]|uniref:Teleost multiple tissue opsin b n=1 Tax=Lates japonicus TaxID=270547 RepID=A0AAD3R4C2_LATJO|nr:teleost multiple tissue opsin b [Lates japonicus]
MLSLSQVRSVGFSGNSSQRAAVLVMVITMVVCYLICWLPCGALVCHEPLGPPDLLTPEASITPSLLAKFSTVINPCSSYIFMNKRVKCSLSICYSLVSVD